MSQTTRAKSIGSVCMGCDPKAKPKNRQQVYDSCFVCAVQEPAERETRTGTDAGRLTA